MIDYSTEELPALTLWGTVSNDVAALGGARMNAAASKPAKPYPGDRPARARRLFSGPGLATSL
jgi:hypothetical protein